MGKITGDQFIDLADLLTDSIQAQEIEPQVSLEGKVVVAGPKKQIVKISDFVMWTEAFTIFPMILCHLLLASWRDHNQYNLIIQMAKRFPGKSWLNCDINNNNNDNNNNNNKCFI